MQRHAAIVTGGRQGIGRGIAYALAEAGFDIVLIDLVDDAATRQTLDGIARRGVRSRFIAFDIADVAQSAAICDQAFAAFGRIDVLVNNAGVQVADRSADVLHTTLASFDRLMDINLRGTFFLTQAVAKRMVTVQPEGFRAIVTISSSNALHAKTNGAEYCLSKSALSMMNKIFALQLAPNDIACYEVQPGLIKTDMNASVHDKYEPLVHAGLSPVRRWGTADDVAAVVATLATGKLPFVTGEVLHVDGGIHIPKSPFESPFVKQQLG